MNLEYKKRSDYDALSQDELKARITARKSELGKRLVILAHHYQREEIVPFGDYLGDSLILSQKAASQKEAEYIVFCGVNFMAEAAEILSQPHQKVYLPNPDAGCYLADCANKPDVDKAWAEITQVVAADSIVPCVYINSNAELKAFCGDRGGLTCTSSNADKALDWGMAHGERIFFFPDQHLGRNTAKRKGFTEDERILWNPVLPLGGNTEEEIKRSKIILWDGNCCVHMNFTAEMVEARRRQYPGIKVIVHPESREEVVDAADAAGSTKNIVEYLQNAKEGESIAIGTEWSMVNRVAKEFPQLNVMNLAKEPLRPICETMYITSLADLLYTIENLDSIEPVRVAENVKAGAKTALNRMLEL